MRLPSDTPPGPDSAEAAPSPPPAPEEALLAEALPPADWTTQENATPRLPLRANFAWTFSGNVIYSLCQWGMLSALAKLRDPETVGRFALGLAIGAPVIMLTNLQLRAVQASDARGEHRFGDYLALRLAGTALAVGVIAAVALLGYAGETALVILLVGLSKGVEALSDVFYGLLQQQERMDRMAQSLMLRGPLSLLALGGLVWLTGSLVWGCAGLIGAWLVVLLAYDLRSGALILRRLAAALPQQAERFVLAPRWDWPTLRGLVWLTLPLGLTMMLISLNTNVPRYFLGAYRGEAELGLFAALAYLMMASWTVCSALGQSALPRLARYYARGQTRAFVGLVLKLQGIGVGLGVAGVLVAALWGRPLLTLLYRPEYGEQAEVFVWIAGAAGVSYLASFLNYGLTATRHFRVQLPLHGLATGVTVAGCIGLIPIAGLQGAAWALLLAAVVQLTTTAAILAGAVKRAGAGREDGQRG